MNLRALWLLFAQAAVIFMAASFVAIGLWYGFAPPTSYRAVISQVIPSVVRIYGRNGDETNSVGAGVIISQDGDILTNYHLIAARETVEVGLGKKRHIAKLTGIDPEIDLAVLNISTGSELPAISFAKDSAAAGDIVLAIGNPFGFANSASMGIVSAIGRNKVGINHNGLDNLIQTDAAINPGSSGGALANTAGELIGINTALYSRRRGRHSPQGVSFAVPAKAAQLSYIALRQEIQPPENPLGAEVRIISPRLLKEVARLPSSIPKPVILISKIWKDSLAAQSGLKIGDIIISIDGANTEQAAQAGHLPATTRSLHVFRNDKETTIIIGPQHGG